MSDKNNSLLIFLLGGLIGAVIALLYAPKSGRETRQDICRFKDSALDAADDFIDSACKACSKVYDCGYEKFLDIKEKAKLDEKLEYASRKLEDAKRKLEEIKDKFMGSQRENDDSGKGQQ
jgi:gas vesicle protein